jgi:hypothetical protein
MPSGHFVLGQELLQLAAAQLRERGTRQFRRFDLDGAATRFTDFSELISGLHWSKKRWGEFQGRNREFD